MRRFGFSGGGVAPFTELALLGSPVVSTGTTITIPGTIQAGDFCLCLNTAVGSSLASEVIPSGFTKIDGIGGIAAPARIRGVASARILDGADAGRTLTGMTGTTHQRLSLTVFRPDGPLHGWTAHSLQSAVSGSTITHTIPASGAASVPVLLFANRYNGYSTTFDAGGLTTLSLSSSSYAMAYRLYNSSPSNHSPSSPGGSGANMMHSGYLRFS